ncbi:tetratricopeptide repeat protein [Pedobacter fastidiosus]|uniref:Tetratricopeptide repeat protein n=1 Tax=Pedobacter fastidiosus TaxID=2765361 RepID=A0ABR7KSC8_9SPHI|nr:hypothetical protein [Pedobacter fastidiosus]MBC6111003.1 hypothetical protein [Pedobacter fastidiosus]
MKRVLFWIIILNLSYFDVSAQILDTANLEVSKKYVRVKFSTNPKIDALCIEGQELYSMSLFRKGLDFYKQADSLEGNNYHIKGGIAWGYMHLSNYGVAIDNFNYAIAINKTDSSSKRNIILCYLYKKDYERAILEGKKYLKEYPTDPESYYNLMTVFYYNKDPKNAIKFGKRAIPLYEIKKSRSIYDAYYFLGKIYYEQHDYKNSDKMFQLVRARGIKIEDKYLLKH